MKSLELKKPGTDHPLICLALILFFGQPAPYRMLVRKRLNKSTWFIIFKEQSITATSATKDHEHHEKMRKGYITHLEIK